MDETTKPVRRFKGKLQPYELGHVLELERLVMETWQNKLLTKSAQLGVRRLKKGNEKCDGACGLQAPKAQKL